MRLPHRPENPPRTNKSVQALAADIRYWTAVERDPRPLACTKTTEQILNSLTENYPRFQADDTSDYPAQVEPCLLHFHLCLSARGVAWGPCMGRKH